jgi:hypothetical protein
MSKSKRPERWRYDRIVSSSGIAGDESDEVELSTIAKKDVEVDIAG